MPSPVLEEGLKGILGGCLTVPTYLLLWPLVPLASRLFFSRLLSSVFGNDSFVLDLLKLVFGLAFFVAVVGLPTLLINRWLAHWRIMGMEFHPTIGRLHFASTYVYVYFVGFVIGTGA